MNRTTLNTLLLMLAAVALAACGAGSPEATTAAPTSPEPTIAPTASPEPTDEPITVTDSRGEEIQLQKPVSRVVSLAPSNTEILFALEAGEQVVGRDEFSDYPEAATAIPSIGSTYGDLNVEAIVGLEPDLVLAAGITPPEQVQALEEVELPVFVLGNPEDFEGLFENLRKVGELTGRPAEAEALVENLEKRVAAVTEKTNDVEPVSLFYEVDGSDPAAPYTAGSGTFHQLIFDLAGGNNIASDLEGWVQMSLEEIVVRDPEVIIFGTGPFVPTTVDSLKERPGWDQISAVQEDRVYAVNTDLLDLPGPRLVEGLETVAGLLHPELFVP